ncbi:MAG: peptidylprolyl isomerase [Victivallales bacterium]|nr:peptidylprolyl isomerase [Victivallales bacterium]
MKKLVVLLLVLVAFSTFAGQIKLRNGQSYEGETKLVGKVVTLVKDGAVFQFPLKDVAELDGKVIEREDNPVVRIATTKGDIFVELYEDDAPNTVANFIELAEKGFYKGMAFHRVINGFMAQGGCPNSKRGAVGTPGTGGPGYTFDNEISSRRHDSRGILSMANAGPNTNGSQFFLCFKETPWLDGKHTVFGKVTKGLEVLDKLEAIGTGSGKPSEEVRFNIEVVSKRNHEYKVKKN